MSVPFTTITRGSNLQATRFTKTMTLEEMQAATNKTILDELTLAIRERLENWYVIGGGYHFKFYDNLQTTQQWVSGGWNDSGYMPDLYFIVSYYRDWLTNMYFTGTSTWEETVSVFLRAGLRSPDGFSGTKEWDGMNDPTWTVSGVDWGYILGSWVYVELQKFYSQFRRSINWDIWFEFVNQNIP